MFDYSQMILEYLYQIKINGDFDGSFHKSLDLEMDLSAALLGHRSHG
jgi:peroxiredoxin